MKQQFLYDVQSYGVTIEFTNDIREANSAFNGARGDGHGQVVMYQLDKGTSVKKVVRRK